MTITFRRQQGFTLIEISVALAVLAVMLLGALPVYRNEQLRGKESELRQALTQIRRALDEYKRAGDEGRIAKPADASGYPESLDALVRGVQRIGIPRVEVMYFLRQLPRDPFAEDASVTAALTWQTRSYASPPDSPSPGRDVFDVFSKSTKLGTNGVPYNKW